MLKFLRTFFTKDIGLKVISLILALVVWFYIVHELNKGTEEERQFLKRLIPSQEMAAKKFQIRPIFVGKVRHGYEIANGNVLIVPESCIVVGTQELLEKIRFVYTMPIDVRGAYKTFTKSVPLNPIAPGIYMGETTVQVTVPIEQINR